ncbi:cupin domain-containing protein [Paenibacillus pasadenensis]|uniref:cupin domain-containing protein n=1 Tax=Paenibacillus pasadenensis TaxID=217090 RepID=UPI00203DF307|nr:cupin domain-containing protein [Paenibacillus pasadenensis]MCM3746760.1 cupin domain-containing protein [Paenibacillus pasadenensis]
MKIYRLPDKEQPVHNYGSSGVMFSGITRQEGRIQLSSLRVEPNAVIGRQAAATSQLCLLIDGEGWVSGTDHQRITVRAGQAAYWDADEEHEFGTKTGMTLLLVEGDELIVEMEELASF